MVNKPGIQKMFFTMNCVALLKLLAVYQIQGTLTMLCNWLDKSMPSNTKFVQKSFVLFKASKASSDYFDNY